MRATAASELCRAECKLHPQHLFVAFVCLGCRVPTSDTTLPSRLSALQLRCAVMARIVCVHDERLRSVLVEHCTGLIDMGGLHHHDALIGRILFVDDDSRNFPDSDAPAWASFVNGVSFSLGQTALIVPCAAAANWSDWRFVLQWSEQ